MLAVQAHASFHVSEHTASVYIHTLPQNHECFPVLAQARGSSLVALCPLSALATASLHGTIENPEHPTDLLTFLAGPSIVSHS